jgi:ribosome-binding protein aMBF1 (putative translation factor)
LNLHRRPRGCPGAMLQQISYFGIILFSVSLSCRSSIRRPALSSLFPDLYEECLARLVEARKHAGVTQMKLAERLQRPQSFVAKYEGRERRLDVAEYLMIARALSADPYKLLRRVEKAKG